MCVMLFKFQTQFSTLFMVHFQNHTSSDVLVKFLTLLSYLKMILFLTNKSIICI